MKISKTHRYPIPSSDLISVFLNEDFFHSRYKMANISDYEIVEFGEKGNQLIVSVKRPIAIRAPANLPRALRKFIDRENTVITTVVWELQGEHSRLGQYSLDFVGVPLTVKGTNAIKADGENSINQIDLTVTSSIPLLGKKVATMAGGKIASGVDKDHLGTLAYIEHKFGSTE